MFQPKMEVQNGDRLFIHHDNKEDTSVVIQNIYLGSFGYGLEVIVRYKDESDGTVEDIPIGRITSLMKHGFLYKLENKEQAAKLRSIKDRW